MTRRPSVFVCYTHDSAEHKQLVLDFCTFLKSSQIDVCLDQQHPPVRQDWYRWALAEIPAADFVLAIASPEFRAAADGQVAHDRNRGAQAEAAVLRELLHEDRETWTERILPVVLPGRDISEIPMFLQPRTADHYLVDSFTEEGTADLLNALHRRPGGQRCNRQPRKPPKPPRPSGGNVQHIVSNGSGTIYANQGGEQTIQHW